MDLNTILSNPETLLQNQFLVGGVGTIAIGALGYVVRSVPRRVFAFFESTFSTSFTITTRYKQYDQIAVLLQRYAIQAIMRNFAPAKSQDTNSYYRPGKKKKMPMNLAPGYGSGWAVFQGKVAHFTRAMMESKEGETLNEQIKVRFFTRDIQVVSNFLAEAEGLEDGDFLKLHIQESSYFGSALRKTRREMSTVFAPASVKGRLMDRFQWFFDNEAWYRQRGIPYKFCAVLYGPPGTGKTSLVHAIATEFNLAINYVNGLGGIQTLFSECGPNDLIVIEDVDALAPEMKRNEKEEREEAEKKAPTVGSTIDSFALHRLLNAIDGFCTPHGLKVMMTTNHLEKLDPALLRSGRTDLLLEVGPLGQNEIREMYRAFYGEAEEKQLAHISDTFRAKGADLQELFLTKSAAEARDELAKMSRIATLRRAG